MLKTTGGITGAAAVNVLASNRSDAAQTERRLKVIVCGGHPGDPEYGCGGTVARFTALGHDVVLLYLNDGSWKDTSAAVRIAEAKEACGILKARPVYANQINGHAIVDNAHYEAFKRIIDAEKPDVVFNQWLIDNHPDHRAIASLMFESWRQSDRKFPMYYYEVSDGEDTTQFGTPTHYVDISSVLDAKKTACYAHASQNPDYFYRLQDTVAAFRGLQSGYKRAEAYVLQTGSPHDIFQVTGFSRA